MGQKACRKVTTTTLIPSLFGWLFILLTMRGSWADVTYSLGYDHVADSFLCARTIVAWLDPKVILSIGEGSSRRPSVANFVYIRAEAESSLKLPGSPAWDPGSCHEPVLLTTRQASGRRGERVFGSS